MTNPIAPDSNKTDELDNVQRDEKSPESPKTIKKLESFSVHDLENIQNVTRSTHLVNTPLLYRKNNSGGYNNNVCVDNKYFLEEIPILRIEPVTKKLSTIFEAS